MEFTVSSKQDGRILRNVLQADYKLSRRLLRQLIQNNGIVRNHKVIYLTERIHQGDIINITFPPETSNVTSTPMPLDIRYEDDEIVVVNKPPGVLAHPTAWEREGSLLSGLLAYLNTSGSTDIGSPEIVPHCVHRLDRDTSGVVMFAKNSHAHHLFDIALQGDAIHRGYCALAHIPSPAPAHLYDWQTINLPIGGDANQPSRRIISFDGQPSVTHYRLLLQQGSVGLVQLALETGRTHQIRLHLAATGMPIIGDRHYNWSYCMVPGGQERITASNAFEEWQERIERQALHAYRLEWTHPISKETHSVTAMPPHEFQDLLCREGLTEEQWQQTLEKLLSPPFAPPTGV